MNAPQLHPKVTPLRVLERKLLEFRGVDKRFHVNGQWHTAVEGVDLEIAQGELVTLVGPSGCGKSTLLNMTAGMFGPSAGRVLYRGEELTGLNHRVGDGGGTGQLWCGIEKHPMGLQGHHRHIGRPPGHLTAGKGAGVLCDEARGGAHRGLRLPARFGLVQEAPLAHLLIDGVVAGRQPGRGEYPAVVVSARLGAVLVNRAASLAQQGAVATPRGADQAGAVFGLARCQRQQVWGHHLQGGPFLGVYRDEVAGLAASAASVAGHRHPVA